MNIPYVMKKCSKCGEWLVANTDNFHKAKTGKYGLRKICKECMNKKRKQYYETNKDKEIERSKRYYEANSEYYKQYREANKEKTTEYDKQYYLVNRDKKIEQRKQYRETNKEKITEYNKQYRQNPQGQVVAFNNRQRRRIKEEQQGTGITKDQWLELMSFFDWKCAYSGETLTKDNRSVDHIVPIDAGGDNMIWNMVPMLRNLNSSKHTKEMLEWYRGQDFYSEARLAKIYKWQEYAYNKWGKDTEYFNTNDIQISLI